MPKNRYQSITSQSMSDRLNPEFIETTSKYLLQKKQRQEIDKKRMALSNQVKHFQKVNETLESSLEKRSQQLKWLKQVRNRYVTDIENKMKKQEQEQLRLEQLRMENTTMRQKSIDDIHNALSQLQKRKSKAHNEVVRNLEHLKKQYSAKKQKNDQANHSMYEEMRRSRMKGKNNVNKFFRKKNTEVTKLYKRKLHDEEGQFIDGICQIEELTEKESKYKKRIDQRQSRLREIDEEINSLKRSSRDLAASIIKSSRFSVTKMMSKTQRAAEEEKSSSIAPQNSLTDMIRDYNPQDKLKTRL